VVAQHFHGAIRQRRRGGIGEIVAVRVVSPGNVLNIRLVYPHAIPIQNAVEKTQAVAGNADDPFYEVAAKVGRVTEDYDIAAADGLVGKGMRQRAGRGRVRHLVHDDVIAGHERGFHGAGRYHVRHGDGGGGEDQDNGLAGPVGDFASDSHTFRYAKGRYAVRRKYTGALMPERAVKAEAGSREFEERIQGLADRVHARFRYHSIELPDGSVLPGLQSIEHLRWRLDRFELAEDLRGKRVLDIGAWDGWFSFECERRGADVVAVDCVEMDTFVEARQLLESKVEYLTLDVNELSARQLGRFDVVLFFGVLYHLRHPLLGLEKAVELSRDIALIESFVIPTEDRRIRSVMEFYERAELGGQIDNWCGPTPECAMSMCRSAGFAQVDLMDVTEQRASIVCRRRWPEPDAAAGGRAGATRPQLHSVVNNRTYVSRFHPLKDEYLCCYFKSREAELRPDDLFVEVDGFGTQTLGVTANGPGGYQADCLRPPGLEPGRHEVRLRTRQSERSNPAELVMVNEDGSEPALARRILPAEAPELCSAEYFAAGDMRIVAGRGGSLVCYFRSTAETPGASDVWIEAGEKARRADTISLLGDGVWQANLLLEERLPAGIEVRLRLEGGEWSQAMHCLDRSA
jgi:tRNA (mo5U34)-methyltransferase